MSYYRTGRYTNPDRNFVLQGAHLTENQPNKSTADKLSKSMSTSYKSYNPGRYSMSYHQLTSSDTSDWEHLRKSPLLGHTLLSPKYHSFTQEAELRERLRNLPSSDWYTQPVHLPAPVYIPMDADDLLAARYFPVTMGVAKSVDLLDEINPTRTRSRSPGRKGRSRRVRSQSASPTRVNSRAEAKRLDNTFFLTEVAPHIKRADITFTSPFRDELAKLRMDKLRIEEQQYLELKRHIELERIRGPTPKWYELRTPEFHYEAYKNNELLRNSGKWDELLKYRESLQNASKRLYSAIQGHSVPVN